MNANDTVEDKEIVNIGGLFFNKRCCVVHCLCTIEHPFSKLVLRINPNLYIDKELARNWHKEVLSILADDSMSAPSDIVREAEAKLKTTYQIMVGEN